MKALKFIALVACAAVTAVLMLIAIAGPVDSVPAPNACLRSMT